MMPVVTTSRIVMANNTIQLWIDRVLLQLENILYQIALRVSGINGAEYIAYGKPTGRFSCIRKTG
jgi:hypothetical protein